MLPKVALLFHLLGFAAYTGAGFAQQRFMAASLGTGLVPAVRDAYEQLAALIVTRIELPAIFVSVLTGAWMLSERTALLRFGWMHGKLTAVLALLVLSHLEM